MPNDAKLGLLAGVVGVVLAYLVLVNKPQQPPVTPPKQLNPTPAPEQNTSPPKPTTESASTPEKLPTTLGSTPVVRTKKELDATPTSRSPNKDADLDP
jgi:hypothetical protein